MTRALNKYNVSTTMVESTISFDAVKNMLSGWYSPINTSIINITGIKHVQIIFGYEENGIYQGLYVIDPQIGGPRRIYYNFDDYISNPNSAWQCTWYNNKKAS